MDEKIIAIYCLVDDLLKSMHHYENSQIKMSDSEIMTTTIIATLFFSGNFERARFFLKSAQYFPNMITKGRFNIRLHRISHLFLTFFEILGETFKKLNSHSVYLIDSYPVPVCDNIRISRCKLYRSKKYRGFIASKRRYFYGLRLHLMVTKDREPVEFFLCPGSTADVNALKVFQFDLAKGSKIYGDSAFTDYTIEDLLKEQDIYLYPVRKKNSKRLLPPPEGYFQHLYRQNVETAGSLINRLMPKSIHAVTSKGFELKVMLFVLAYSINCLYK